MHRLIRLIATGVVGFVLVHSGVVYRGETQASEIFGTAKVAPSYWSHQHLLEGSHRVALPTAALRGPSGFVVLLDGEGVAQDSFAPPTDVVHLTAVAGGIEPRVVACQSGSTIELENKTEEALRLRGDLFSGELIEIGAKKSQVMAKPGLFHLVDNAHPAINVAIVVGVSPFEMVLDQGGEFLFEDLKPGQYTIKLFADGAFKAQAELTLGASGRQTVAFNLTNDEHAKTQETPKTP